MITYSGVMSDNEPLIIKVAIHYKTILISLLLVAVVFSEVIRIPCIYNAGLCHIMRLLGKPTDVSEIE